MSNKQRTTVLMLVFLLILPTAIFAAEGVFTAVSGKVEYQLPGRGWQKASTGTRIPTGAMISTGFKSEASLEIDSALLLIKPLTRMRIDELVQKEGVISTDLHLRVGRVRANVKAIEGLQNEFKLTSPVSTAAVRGTSFEYDGVNVQVFSGSVRLGNRFNIGGLVSAGESGSAPGAGTPLTGAGAREAELLVLLNTLPGFSDYEGLLSSLFGPLRGLEYGSVGGTVHFPGNPE
jgi:hypothetical protein